VFKLDWALSEPIPWRSPDCRRAATVHLGGTLEEIAASEAQMSRGEVPDAPYVLIAQHTLFDPSRAPAGKHTAWGYFHVPFGCTLDLTDRLEDAVERFAPGFRDVVLARSRLGAAELERDNANLVGGDITGGATDWRQILARPTLARWPHRTPNPRIYLCSSSTPPGAGVHGMCGHWAAQCALRHALRD
jgi:phytoene dehydrogenase-like protein